MNMLLVLIILFIILVFFVNMVLITRFFVLIKQTKYSDNSLLWNIPDYYPKIDNKYIKWFLNYLTINIVVFIAAFFVKRFPSSPSPEAIFDQKFWYKVLVIFIIVTIILTIIFVINKMNFLYKKPLKLYYIELIAIPVFAILSLYFFNVTFEWFESYYFHSVVK